MPTATVTSKGQITIPKAVREALGLEPGDRVAFRLLDNAAMVEPETVDLKELFGSLHTRVKGVSVDDMEAAIAHHAGKR
jgi:AbrB family looped-hinge helix DNA binding protein